MAQIVDIRPLRVNGVRAADLSYAVSGQFRVRNLDGQTELALVGHKTGRILLCPLRNPKLVAAEPMVSGCLGAAQPSSAEFPLW